jgi:hypothetical protein
VGGAGEVKRGKGKGKRIMEKVKGWSVELFRRKMEYA